jgi:5-methyltetrahydrofolate--homocysteine methyltransferase
MPYMQVIIRALREAGLRDKVIVLVGGAPLNEAFAEEIEADAYCRDAAVAVETAKKLIAIKREKTKREKAAVG